ncbi:hypothetical protein [Nocardiopsis potens]|nr:hypothetical protein [Nocardiopsis potens]
MRLVFEDQGREDRISRLKADRKMLARSTCPAAGLPGAFWC